MARNVTYTNAKSVDTFSQIDKHPAAVDQLFGSYLGEILLFAQSKNKQNSLEKPQEYIRMMGIQGFIVANATNFLRFFGIIDENEFISFARAELFLTYKYARKTYMGDFDVVAVARNNEKLTKIIFIEGKDFFDQKAAEETIKFGVYRVALFKKAFERYMTNSNNVPGISGWKDIKWIFVGLMPYNDNDIIQEKLLEAIVEAGQKTGVDVAFINKYYLKQTLYKTIAQLYTTDKDIDLWEEFMKNCDEFEIARKASMSRIFY